MVKGVELSQRILDFDQYDAVVGISKSTDGAFDSEVIDITFPQAHGPDGLEQALSAICRKAESAVQNGKTILILSDSKVDSERVAIPALLATSGVHHHLVRLGLRTKTGLVVSTGSARETHHFALLAGYGAEAIHPWLAMETLSSVSVQLKEDADTIYKNYVKAIGKGLNKVMSKMGRST